MYDETNTRQKVKASKLYQYWFKRVSIPRGIMALFYSTKYIKFQPPNIYNYFFRRQSTSIGAGMYFFNVVKSKYLSLYSGRSPPINLVAWKLN